MKTMKRIKMIVVIVVAIVSLGAIVGLFSSNTSALFVFENTPGMRWVVKKSVESKVIEYRRLDSVIAVKNLQIDSLAQIEQKSDADKILKSNYEVIKNDYEQQERYIDSELHLESMLIGLMIVFFYVGIFILAIVYLCDHIHLGKKK